MARALSRDHDYLDASHSTRPSARLVGVGVDPTEPRMGSMPMSAALWQPSRVAILAQHFFNGPFALLNLALARGLRECGVAEVDLVYMKMPPQRQLPDGVRAVPLGARHSSVAAPAIAQFLAKRRPELLISMSAEVNIAAISGWLLARVPATTLIVSEHTSMSYSCWVEHRDRLKLRFLPPLARMLYPRASGVHAVSTGVLDDLIDTIGVRVPENRRVVIPNSVDVDHVRRLAASPAQHPWLERPRRIPVAIAVGRTVPEKNYPLLLDAVEVVRRSRPLRLLAVGDGIELPRLQAEVRRRGLEDSVAFIGYLTNPYAHIASADLLVLGSDQEGFGLVVPEAMACGTPVVSTATAGPMDIMQDGSGILTPIGDRDALARGILSVLDDPDLAASLIERGRSRVASFAPGVIAERWLAFAAALR
jgi:glycosyltransferase involved in cell wall biosynthesis